MFLLIPMMVPLGLWEDFLGMLNAMMTPLYWAVSGILVGFHSLLSNFMNPDSGWTWTLSIVLLTMVTVSYTHLDVYKRQVYDNARSSGAPFPPWRRAT